jgi:hypothetical protein
MRIKVLIGLILALLAGCWVANGQMLIGRPRKPLGVPCGSFTANTAVLDGTTDFLTRSSLTGISDGKTFTFSGWFQDTSGNANAHNFFAAGAGYIDIYITIHKVVVAARNAAGATILDGVGTVNIGSSWTHVYVCVDLANSANRHVYVNGVEDSSYLWSTYTNDTIDMTHGSYAVGASVAGFSKFKGAFAEFWFNNTYLDSPSSFVCTTAGTHPLDLGTTGQTPTGSSPIFYLSKSGSGNSWATDSSGSGNTFTVNGTALGSTTSP